MANYLFLLSTDAERIFINGKDFLKGDVFAKTEGDGFRLYAKDPLYPITTHLSIHTAAKLVGDVVTPFANDAALETWVGENVLNIGNLVLVPAPPSTGTKMLVSTDGVLSWEDIPTGN